MPTNKRRSNARRKVTLQSIINNLKLNFTKKKTGKKVNSRVNKSVHLRESTAATTHGNVTKKGGKKNKKNKSKALKIIKWGLIIFVVLIIIAAAVIAGIISGILKKEVISIDKLRISTENTVVLDADGNVIATLNADEIRESITIDNMSRYIPMAFVAIEDERFYEHQGVDLKRTAAATIKYIFNRGNANFGGSTITQQLVKNITKEDERDATRKIKEMARAYNLEKSLTKDEILELYLNMIFMGDHVYGVQMASKLYFNKSAAELDLAESAFLAGINNSPNMYKPFSEEEAMKEKIKSRTRTVIEKMHDLGRISEEEYNEAMDKVNNNLVFTKGNVNANNYSYHTDAVINQVIADIQKANPDMNEQAARFYLYNSGLTIYSTQVTSLQETMEAEFSNTKYLVNSNINWVKDEDGNDTDVRATTQAAMVMIDHTTGQVVATVGGFGEKTSRGFNRATQQPRQPGSTIKPIAVIAPSLEAGLITAGTVVDDTPVHFGSWSPNNSPVRFLGLMTVRNIIKVSENIPEIKMLQKLGVENSIAFLKQLGVTTLVEEGEENDVGLALALGGLTEGITPLEMAGAYATIANDGVYIEPTFYTKVVDADGNVVLEAHQETRTVMSADNAYILKSILRGPVSPGGTYPEAKIYNMDTCGKTGTTDENQRWFCGFTPYYTATTWYGFDLKEKLWTGNTAAAIWKAVMSEVHKDLEYKEFKPTGNIQSGVRICSKSGLLPTEVCEEAGCVITEMFVRGTIPTKPCETHVKEKVCLQEDGTYKLATEYCPDAVKKIFITRPNSEEDKSWEKAADAGEMLPTEICEVHTQPPEPEESPEPSSPPTDTPTVSPSVPPIITTPSVVPSSTPIVITSVEPSAITIVSSSPEESPAVPVVTSPDITTTP